MRKNVVKLKYALFAVALVAAVLICALAACTEKDITSLTATRDSLTLAIGDTVDAARYIESEGAGRIFYAVENSENVELDGSVLKGVRAGKSVLVVMGGEFVLRIPVTVTEAYSVYVTFADVTATYDGNNHTVSVVGDLPIGSRVTYTCNGEPFEGAVDAGEYTVTARLELPEKYEKKEDMTATLTIKKARYDMSGVGFYGRAFTYDGAEKTVMLSGSLPAGIGVTYTGNRATEVGEYIATATFSGERKNYEKIADMTCKFKIEPAVIALADRGFGNKRLVYDGIGYVGGLSDLPANSRAEYYIYSDNKYEKIDSAPYYLNAGKYCYYVKIVADERAAKNYIFTVPNNVLILREANGELASDYLEISVIIDKATLATGSMTLFNEWGEAAEHVPYGSRLSLGSGEGYTVRTVGSRLDGVSGEFAGLFGIEYTINGKSDTGSLLNEYGNLDSGIYHIKTHFIMPEGYTVNYNEVEDSDFDVNVKRAVYDMSGIRFNSEKSEEIYSGEEFVFRLDGETDSLRTTYFIWKNGVAADSVLHAGDYEIRAKSTLIRDAKNYAPIDDVVMYFTVKPQVIELNGISFKDKKTVYDGTVKIFEIDGILPSGVSVTYSQARFVDAGKYSVMATLESDVSEERGDYIFSLGDGRGEGRTLTATLTVDKASFTGEEIEGREPVDKLTYFYGMRLADVGFKNNSDGYVRWKNAEEEVGDLTASTDGGTVNEAIGEFSAVAVYNSDSKNYNDYEYRTKIIMNKGLIDLTDASVPDQFVPREGNVLGAPTVRFANGDYSTETLAKVTFGASNVCRVTLSAVKPSNYRIVGNTVFEGVKIYPYDPSEYAYAKGTTTLLSYLSGSAIASIPDGTEGIREKAFDSTGGGRTQVAELTLPDTVKTLGENTLYGMTALEKLNVASLYGAQIISLFGRHRPSSLSVTVREDETVGTRAFYNAGFVVKVKYLRPVTRVGREAFYGCSLEELSADFGRLEGVGSYAFYECSRLLTLELPYIMDEDGEAVKLSYYFGPDSAKCGLKTVKLISERPYEIANNTFDSIYGITSITLSDALTSVGESAFRNISVPVDLSRTAVAELTGYAFSSYLGESVILPNGLTGIGAYAFMNAVNLKRLDMPSGLERIGYGAFYGCAAEIVFSGSKYTSVGEETFKGYEGKSLTLPTSVTRLGKKAFNGAKIESLGYLPALTYIGESCFNNCARLTEFTFADTVEEIGSNAFVGCAATKLIFMGDEPPTKVGINVFDRDNFGRVTVYIRRSADADLFGAFIIKCNLEERFEALLYI